MALLVTDANIGYHADLEPLMPNIKALIAAFRTAGLPIFWSTWWRFSADDGYFNAQDRWAGPIGSTIKDGPNLIYLKDISQGELEPSIGPITDTEHRRVLRKSFSYDAFTPAWATNWAHDPNNDNPPTLDAALTELGVDTIVQVGVWTDACILSTAITAAGLQYDSAVVQDAVATETEYHKTALRIMGNFWAKLVTTEDVVHYLAERSFPEFV